MKKIVNNVSIVDDGSIVRSVSNVTYVSTVCSSQLIL